MCHYMQMKDNKDGLANLLINVKAHQMYEKAYQNIVQKLIGHEHENPSTLILCSSYHNKMP